MLANLIGLWMYTGLIFQGKPVIKPSPELVIYYYFINNTENSILYFRQGDKGFCERHAVYSIQQDQIAQKIVKTNPENADSCSQDPDMQMNRLSFTKFEVKNDVLYLHLPLGEDYLTYVWTKVF